MQTVYANTVFVCKTYASCIQAMHTIDFMQKIDLQSELVDYAHFSHIYMGILPHWGMVRSV